MDLWNLYRQKELSKAVLTKVKALAQRAADKLGRRPVIMEVCGTHTVALGRSGLRELLEDCLDLRSGPGCPVCVTAAEDIDYMILLARQPDVFVATFGDMLKVPGSYGSLEQSKAEGACIHVCYSPREAVELARSYPDKIVIFLGIGFETTAPLVALALKEAMATGLKNFVVYSAHKLVPPALSLLATDPELGLDGFILPGHVSAILGRQAFAFLAEKHHLPAAIAGFEPLDILGALMELILLILNGEPQVLNSYPRVVTEKGNLKAQEILQEIFYPCSANWRGLGSIPDSGLKLKKRYQDFDAQKRYPLQVKPSPPPPGCRCGDILKGLTLPTECPLFARRCTPATPVGPCMVSSEGSCAAYFRYSRRI